MRRPTATDYLSAAMSVVLWVFGFLLIITGFHVTRASESNLLPSLTDCGIYYLVALLMHLIFARRIATMRGWRFWLMPIVTVSLVAVLVFVLQLIPTMWSSLRFHVWAKGESLEMQRFAAEQEGQLVHVLRSSLYRRVVMVHDLIFLMYPLLIAHQFLIRVLYRNASTHLPAHAEGVTR